MNSPKNKIEELNELNSGLPGEAGEGPFKVPEGYFKDLAGSVLARIRAEEQFLSAREEIAALSPLLAGMNPNLPYAVPEGYFTQTIENLSILTSEEDSLMLSFVEKEGPYDVPSGYFASFPNQVMDRIREEKGAKVVPMVRRKWMRFAVAAVMTGMLAISGINYFNRGGNESLSNELVTVEIEKASTEELNAFIKTATDVTLTDDRSTAQRTTNDVEKMLDNVSDNELEAFLDEVPVADESFELNL